MTPQLLAFVLGVVALVFFLLWLSARAALVRQKEEMVSILGELKRLAIEKRRLKP